MRHAAVDALDPRGVRLAKRLGLERIEPAELHDDENKLGDAQQLYRFLLPLQFVLPVALHLGLVVFGRAARFLRMGI